MELPKTEDTQKPSAGWTEAMQAKPAVWAALIAGNNPMAQWPNQDVTRDAFEN